MITSIMLSMILGGNPVVIGKTQGKLTSNKFKVVGPSDRLQKSKVVRNQPTYAQAYALAVKGNRDLVVVSGVAPIEVTRLYQQAMKDNKLFYEAKPGEVLVGVHVLTPREGRLFYSTTLPTKVDSTTTVRSP